MVICPDCGKEVPKNKFCKNCGAYISNIDEPVKIESKPIVEGNALNAENQDKSASCFNCGHELSCDFHFCPNCGQDLTSQKINSKKDGGDKNTLLAVILSVFIPGLGQIYLGLDNKGAIFLIAYIVSVFLILCLIGILFVIIIWVWALIDTIISINALNRGEEVVDKLF